MKNTSKLLPVLVLCAALGGCSSSKPIEVQPRKAPSAFEVMYWQNVNFCYSHQWQDPSGMCAGMASAMATEYIKEHPDRLDEPK